MSHIIYLLEMISGFVLTSTTLDSIPKHTPRAASVCGHNCMAGDKRPLSQGGLPRWHQVQAE